VTKILNNIDCQAKKKGGCLMSSVMLQLELFSKNSKRVAFSVRLLVLLYVLVLGS